MGLFAAVGGGLALVGWATDTPRLAGWFGVGIYMLPNTALSAACAGLALMFWARGHGRAAAVLAAVPLALGVLTLVQHVGGVDLRIDRLLPDRTWGRRATTSPGRMGPPASVSFLLIGLTFLLLTGGKRARAAGATLGLPVAAIAMLSLTGYLFQSDLLYAMPYLTAAAFPTALVLLVLGLGLIACEPQQGIAQVVGAPGPVGRMTRPLLALAVLMPPAIGFAVSWIRSEARVDSFAMALVSVSTSLVLVSLTLVIGRKLEVATGALVQSEERLRLALDTAMAATWSWNLQTNQLGSWDQRYRELYGFESSEPPDFATWSSRIHPEDRERVLARAQAMRDTPGDDVWSEEFRIVHPKRGVRWLAGFGKLTRDADGTPLRISGINIDGTERKRAELEVAEHAALFRTLGEALPDLLWMEGAEGDTLYQNPAWVQYTGLGLERLREDGWEDLVHADDRAALRETLALARGVGTACKFEVRVRRHDGIHRWFLASTVPVHGERGQVIRWVGTATDIEDRKQIERQREQLLESERVARTLAEQATRIKDEFLATLSHELRTPLNAIVGWAYLVRRQSEDPEHVLRGIDIIERNARAQAQLIADMLDMSRIVTGKMRLDMQRVELPVVVHAAIEAIAPAAESKGVRLHSVLDPLVGPVSGDPARLQQIAWNLLSNAVKFTPRGGSVQVVLRQVDSQVELSVQDTGEGIHPAFLPHMFERFRQGDASASRPHGGLGIGLALVKQLVELHGGRVRAASDGPGKGAEFVLELPLAASRSEPAPDAPWSRPSTAEGVWPELAGLRVLLVDDQPEALEMVKRVLESCDAEVVTANSAEKALRILPSREFDLLISDIGMPGQDGYEFLAAVRKRGIVTPAAALTAFARSEDRARAMRSGYQAHLTKPVEPAELFATVASLVGRAARPAEPRA